MASDRKRLQGEPEMMLYLALGSQHQESGRAADRFETPFIVQASSTLLSIVRQPRQKEPGPKALGCEPQRGEQGKSYHILRLVLTPRIRQGRRQEKSLQRAQDAHS